MEGGTHIKITGMQDYNQGRQIKMWHWIYVLKVVMNKKKTQNKSVQAALTIY